ncbi:hypothetical protein ABIC83_002723 [Roseateles asaccharophilus]|uniref:hypothetical protein n=1 Tax=Roseateles asaccharophilus TaxID=582607 RepID=UPI00383354BF
MLQDHDLEHLNSLVSTADIGANEPLARFREHLAGRTVLASQLVFGQDCPSADIPGHVLLASPMSLPAARLDMYASLSGTGSLYNGMFGDGQMLRDPGAERLRLTLTDRPPAPLALQVTVCVHALSGPLASLTPELASVLRRHLSRILLANPVLLHPAILVHANNEYIPISAALARSHHGGLPRRSHFLGIAGLDEKKLETQLKAFVGHPCVRAAMSEQGVRVTDKQIKGAENYDPKVTRLSLVRSMLLSTAPRVEFLGSVMELDDLVAATDRPRLPFSGSLQGSSPLRPQVIALLGNSMTSAFGMVHTAAAGTQVPASMLRSQIDRDFLACIRARMGELRPLLAKTDPLLEKLRSSVMRRIFLSRADQMSKSEVEHNTLAMVRGLVEAGAFKNLEEAAVFVIAHTVGAKRENEILPRSDTTAAIVFLEALGKVAGLGDGSDAATLRSLRAIRHEIETIPPRPTPFRDDWLQACDVMIAERSMYAIMNQILPMPIRSHGADDQLSLDLGGPGNAAPTSPATARRTRAHI